jgi:hypothetical protein
MADDKPVKADKSTRHNAPDQDRAAFGQTVKASLGAAKSKVASIRQTNTWLFIVNVVSPALAGLIATLAAAGGGNQVFAQAAAQTLDGGWKLACILAAIFGFMATISGVFKKQFDDRLAQGTQCVGRLLALDLDITTQNRSVEEAAKEYGEIAKAFPEFVS